LDRGLRAVHTHYSSGIIKKKDQLLAFGLQGFVESANYVACGVKPRKPWKTVWWAGSTCETACLLLKGKLLAHGRAAQKV